MVISYIFPLYFTLIQWMHPFWQSYFYEHKLITANVLARLRHQFFIKI